MMAHHLNAPLSFRPHTHKHQLSPLSKLLLCLEWQKTTLRPRQSAKTYTQHQDSTDYAEGMLVSAGQVGGLLEFSKIEDTLLVNNIVSLFIFSFFAKTTNAATLSI